MREADELVSISMDASSSCGGARGFAPPTEAFCFEEMDQASNNKMEKKMDPIRGASREESKGGLKM